MSKPTNLEPGNIISKFTLLIIYV